MIIVKRWVFFVISSIIIALFVRWGFDGFPILTSIYPATELYDKNSGQLYVEAESSFKLGLDLVLTISIGLSALGIVLLNFIKLWLTSKKMEL